MNTFKRKALFTAVVAGLGVAGSAEAVFLAPNGTGQVLVYPYYTVQNNGTNSWNTYLSIVNTTPDAKAVKVRILEGRTSAEVLDFNLFLSPNDVWTAAIIPSDASDTSAGRIITADRSCTSPAIPAAGEPFRNFQYVGQAAGLGRDLARTREGYVERIEMAKLTGATAAAITHSGGIPDDCSVVQVVDQTDINADAEFPTSGLMGTGTLINVNTGLDAGYKADALEAFNPIPVVTGPGFTTPSLQEAFPPSSVVFNSGYFDGVDPVQSFRATVYRQDFVDGSHVLAGAQAVASVFMHERVMNEYVLDTAAASLTDWVITQPAKNFFVDDVTAAPPYTNILTASGACETVEFSFFDREERGATAGGVDFSPPPPAGDASSICWESTVLSIRNGAAHNVALGAASGVLASRNTTAINITDTFQNGWATLRFTGQQANPASGVGLLSANGEAAQVGSDVAAITVTAALTPAYFGLPVTGFMVRTFSNGTLTCTTGACQGNYASLFGHSYRNLITP